MLWRTTVVVAASAVVVIVGFLAGGLRGQADDRRAKLLAYGSPALAVVAISGIMMRSRGHTDEMFTEAAKQQLAVEPFDVVSVAVCAWWCACLAVLALMWAAVARHLASGDVPSNADPGSDAFAGVVAIVVVAIITVSTVVFNHANAPVTVQTADKIDAPELPAITGTVAYRIDVGKEDEIVPAGPGFVRTMNAPSNTSRSVAGSAGDTGDIRWTLNVRETYSNRVTSTGIGPDSVVIVQDYSSLFGLDATTGSILWVKNWAAFPNRNYPKQGVSAAVVLVQHAEPGPPGPTAAAQGTRIDALSPRTGEVVWSRTFDYNCEPQAWATDTAVLVWRNCEKDADVAARVLDATDGSERSVIRVAELGGHNFSVDEIKGNTVLLTNCPKRAALAMDLSTGKVRYRIPEGQDAVLVDENTLVVPGRQLSVVDLETSAVVPTSLSGNSLDNDTGKLAASARWSRIGSKLTAVAPDGQLLVIDPAGAVKRFPPPCGSKQAIGITAVPGALAVRCDGELVGVR